MKAAVILLVLLIAGTASAGYRDVNVYHLAAASGDTTITFGGRVNGISITCYDQKIEIQVVPVDAAYWTIEAGETVWLPTYTKITSFKAKRSGATSARLKIMAFYR